MVREFEDKLAHDGRSQAMVRKVRVSLSSLVSDALERGLIAHNVVRELRAKRKPGREWKAERRQKGKLKVGVDIPTPEEIRAIVGAATGRWRPFLLTAIFTGLRASELRGLRWQDVDLAKRELHVRQRADRYLVIGSPKSEAGERSVPLPPLVVNTLREWKLVCHKNDLDLVFPSKFGRVEHHVTAVTRGLALTLIAAGVTVTKALLNNFCRQLKTAVNLPVDAPRRIEMSERMKARVFCAHDRPAIFARLGHSGISMTMDVYGHLFPRGDDAAELSCG